MVGVRKALMRENYEVFTPMYVAFWVVFLMILFPYN